MFIVRAGGTAIEAVTHRKDVSHHLRECLHNAAKERALQPSKGLLTCNDSCFKEEVHMRI